MESFLNDTRQYKIMTGYACDHEGHLILHVKNYGVRTEQIIAQRRTDDTPCGKRHTSVPVHRERKTKNGIIKLSERERSMAAYTASLRRTGVKFRETNHAARRKASRTTRHRGKTTTNPTNRTKVDKRFNKQRVPLITTCMQKNQARPSVDRLVPTEGGKTGAFASTQVRHNT